MALTFVVHIIYNLTYRSRSRTRRFSDQSDRPYKFAVLPRRRRVRPRDLWCNGKVWYKHV